MIEAIESGAVVLTATSRLARELHAQFDAAMRQRGACLWPTPRILPLSNWVESCWPEADQIEVALSPRQDRFLWQQVILDSPESADLLQIAGAAAAAQDAWRLICEWQLPVSEARFAETDDAEAFLRWLRTHQKRCQHSGWIDPFQLMDRVTAPSNVLLAGFDEVTPQMARLLERVGTWRLLDPPRRDDVHASLCICRDAEHELRAAAEWAREVVQARAGARVGVVVPDLAQMHATVDRIFTEVLNPEVALLDAPASGRAFHVSLGGRFADDPVAHSALLILDLAHGSLSLDRMGSLLRSPFLGAALSERSNRALADAALRQPHPSQVTVAALLDACRKHAPLLARIVEKWDKLRRALPAKLLPSAWSAQFARFLAVFEWPGNDVLTSREHQAVTEWDELLSSFATLDAVVGPCRLAAALGALQQLASESGFQSENEGQPVQVMGIPETAGLGFDYLWLAGMTDETWPRRPNPNPFLPISMQRVAGLPKATARRELDYAVRTTARLLNSAGTVIVSCAEREQDRVLRPSPLFTELDRRSLYPVLSSEPRPSGPLHLDPPSSEPRPSESGPSHLDQSSSEPRPSESGPSHLDRPSSEPRPSESGPPHLDRPSSEPRPSGSGPLHPPTPFWPAPTPLDTLSDSIAPAVPPDFVPRGGTRILELQAKCPFRAFAEIRLGARSLEVSEAGLNARDRGSLLHIVLEQVWSSLVTQAALKALSDDELRAVIRAGIEGAFRHKYHKGAFEDAFEREIRLIEADRIETLVSQWLLLEKTRSPFTVESQEQTRRVTIGALQFDARIDRVDRLESGRELILDYKTGEATTDQWEGQRPDSPQVPIYAIAHDQPIAAVAFARISTESCEFEGIAQQANALPDVAAGDVAARLAEWRLVFEKLAEEFMKGDARVDPKTFPATCAFCQLQPLCRIAPEQEVPLAMVGAD